MNTNKALNGSANAELNNMQPGRVFAKRTLSWYFMTICSMPSNFQPLTYDTCKGKTHAIHVGSVVMSCCYVSSSTAHVAAAWRTYDAKSRQIKMDMVATVPWSKQKIISERTTTVENVTLVKKRGGGVKKEGAGLKKMGAQRKTSPPLGHRACFINQLTLYQLKLYSSDSYSIMMPITTNQHTHIVAFVLLL